MSGLESVNSLPLVVHVLLGSPNNGACCHILIPKTQLTSKKGTLSSLINWCYKQGEKILLFSYKEYFCPEMERTLCSVDFSPLFPISQRWKNIVNIEKYCMLLE